MDLPPRTCESILSGEILSTSSLSESLEEKLSTLSLRVDVVMVSYS
jgi:hypothetical protein